MPIKKHADRNADELRPEYDLTSLQGGVQGKYYTRATAGTTLVLLAADVAEAFPTGRAVNQALRSLLRNSRLDRSGKTPHPKSRAPRVSAPKRSPRAVRD